MDKIVLPHLTKEQEEKIWEQKTLGFYAMFQNSKEQKEHTVEEIKELWDKEEDKTRAAWTHVTKTVEAAMIRTIEDLGLMKKQPRIK